MLENTTWENVTMIEDVTSPGDEGDSSRTVWLITIELQGGKNTSSTVSTEIPIMGCPFNLSTDSTPDPVFHLNMECQRLFGVSLLEGNITMYDRLRNEERFMPYLGLPLVVVEAKELTNHLKKGLRNTTLPSSFIDRVRLHGTRTSLLSDVRSKVIKGELSEAFENLVEMRLGHHSKSRKVTNMHYLSRNMRKSVVLSALRSNNPAVKSKMYVPAQKLQGRLRMEQPPAILKKKVSDFDEDASLGRENLDLVWESVQCKYESIRFFGCVSFSCLRHKISKLYLSKRGRVPVAGACIRHFEDTLRVVLFNRSRHVMQRYIGQYILCFVVKLTLTKRR